MLTLTTPASADTAEPASPSRFHWRRWVSVAESTAIIAFVAWAALYLLWPLMKMSLEWRIRHDTPFMLYMAWLMDKWDYVPYRDFFDVNMLGSYLSYQAIGHFFGFTDKGVHQADFILLFVLMALTVVMLWRVGIRAALAAAVLAPLCYLDEGPQMTIQRDYLAIFPAAMGVACAAGIPFIGTHWRAIIAGIGFGMAAAIKPHAILGLVPVIVYLSEEFSHGAPGWRPRMESLFWHAVQAGLGVLLPVLAYVGYLAYYGALGHFLDSAFNYVPLYAAMNGSHAILTGEAKLMYTLNNVLEFNGKWPMFAAAMLGIGAGWAHMRHDSAGRRIVSMVATLMLIYAFYPAVTGQFWTYHYLPFHYWMSVCVCLVFARWAIDAPWQQRILPIVMVLLIFAFIFKPQNNFAPLRIVGKEPPKAGRVDEVADYLKANMRSGDTVQPLDWVGGGMLHAMLYAEARPATRFLTYFDFFHHIDLPYIQNLRKEFMAQLTEAESRFIIEWTHPGREWVAKGPRTTQTFPEAEAYLKLYYEKKKTGNQYVIYERRTMPVVVNR